ncbi:hypothetical protein F5144DRAFT_103328 [Chaetomium tenue]|uniref:Uncharacterized protein n=1 Tax=Chaetomium tenue TaxID=1854479 RepID=A0ACB7PIS3_9PEZI|nr:hypothetical protein F5144DRAFT_103328 [Chaetomium globosum]
MTYLIIAVLSCLLGRPCRVQCQGVMLLQLQPFPTFNRVRRLATPTLSLTVHPRPGHCFQVAESLFATPTKVAVASTHSHPLVTQRAFHKSSELHGILLYDGSTCQPTLSHDNISSFIVRHPPLLLPTPDLFTPRPLRYTVNPSKRFLIPTLPSRHSLSFV